MMNLYCYWIYHPRGDPKIYFDYEWLQRALHFCSDSRQVLPIFLVAQCTSRRATNDIGNTYSINKFQTSIGAKSYKCSHLITPSSKDGGILSPPRGSDSIYPKNFKTRGNVIFTPGILVHNIIKPGGTKNLHPGDPITQITQSADFKTRGIWSPPGELISFDSKIAKFYNPGVQTVQTANLRAASSNPGDIQYFYHLCSILQFGNFTTPEGTLTLVEVMYPARITKPGGRPKKGEDPNKQSFCDAKKSDAKRVQDFLLCDISEGDFWHSGLCQQCSNALALGMFLCVNNWTQQKKLRHACLNTFHTGR